MEREELDIDVYTVKQLENLDYRIEPADAKPHEMCCAVWNQMDGYDNEYYYFGRMTSDGKFDCLDNIAYMYDRPTKTNFANLYKVGNDDGADKIIDEYAETIIDDTYAMNFLVTQDNGIICAKYYDDTFVLYIIGQFFDGKGTKFLYEESDVKGVYISLGCERYLYDDISDNKKVNDVKLLVIDENNISLFDFTGLTMDNFDDYDQKIIAGLIKSLDDYFNLLATNKDDIYLMLLDDNAYLNNEGLIMDNSHYSMDDEFVKIINKLIKKYDLEEISTFN